MDFENWIKIIINTEQPSKEIIGYYFGIFDSGEKKYILYLSGSKEFDSEDDDWACNDDYTPKDKYFCLNQYQNFGWEDVLNNVVEILQNFIKSDLYYNSFFAKAKGIATGFDGGDIVLIKY